MTRFGLAISLLALGVWPAATVLSQNPDPLVPADVPRLLIVEVQTGSSTSASEEFVEIYNEHYDPIPAGSRLLQYKSASGSDWLTKATLNQDIEPRGRYLIGSAVYTTQAGQTSGLGLAKDGGHLRLVDTEDITVIYDQIAWGQAIEPEVSAATAPQPGESLKRKLDEDGIFIDTNHNFNDFIISGAPTPQHSRSITPEPAVLNPTLPPEPAPPAPNPPSETDNASQPAPASNNNYALLEISELLPDPAQPQTDAEDEFVEIYNPTEEAVDLEGYIIKTGKNLTYSFTLPNFTLPAKSYLALFSIDTNLALANSGGQAQILNPLGEALYQVPAYENAKAGQAWANIGGFWQWTDQPTPGEANASGTAQASSELASASLRSGSALRTGQVLAASTAADGRSTYQEPSAAAPNSVNTAVVAGVGSLALLYAAYEYRYDVSNRLQQLRRYFASRRQARS